MKDDFFCSVGIWGQRHYNYLKKHSPTVLVGLCFALLLLHKEQNRIHMPRGFMEDLGDLVGG